MIASPFVVYHTIIYHIAILAVNIVAACDHIWKSYSASISPFYGFKKAAFPLWKLIEDERGEDEEHVVNGVA